MWPLLLLWGCLVLPVSGQKALQGPKEIRGFEGGTVTLQCTYSEELKGRRKYWCREVGILFYRCSSTIYAGKGQETTQGRVSIRDSPQELVFTVTLRDLTLQDAGKYWCGVEKVGRDEAVLMSLLVSSGPCCPPSPSPSYQPLASRSLQPKAKVWQTQPPGLTSPGLYPTITTAKQGKTGTSLYRHTGTSPYAGTSPRAVTSPRTVTSPHTGTSTHAGTSHAESSYPTTQLNSVSAKGTHPVPSSSRSKPRVSIPMVRMLAPVLVLFTLLLATGLIALGSRALRWRKKAQLAAKTQKNEKPPGNGNGRHPEYAMIHPAGPTGPLARPEPSASLYTKIQYLSQTTEEEEATSQAPEGDLIPMPHTCEEELGFSKFISV
ncbi:CMRF35-like molecule 9 isoform X1 [Nycticebus coucang]|uniref:CMRF35-like molecule 9 isoform X1 n=1 Tax=Nycticebus coucang TaxID=9470 RepID=UPI00234D2E38|nr:CMRF35-like molecule 9 isoform X1 [Nycticebus coucang]